MAMQHWVRVQVLSGFADMPGTLVVDEDEIVEQQVVTGIAYSPDEAKITLVGLPDRPGVAGAIFGSLADAAVNVDMIVQNVSPDGKTTDLTFTVGKADLDRASQVLEALRADVAFAELVADPKVSQISVVGLGMRSQPGIAKSMFPTLASKGINIQVISTRSEEHTSELQSLMRISYAVFCLKKKTYN